MCICIEECWSNILLVCEFAKAGRTASVCWPVLFGWLMVDVMTAGTWSLSALRLVDIESCWCRSVVEYVISSQCWTQQWCHSASNDGLLLLMNPSTSPSAPLITKRRPLASIGLSGTMTMWARGGGAKWLTSFKLLFAFYNCTTTWAAINCAPKSVFVVFWLPLCTKVPFPGCTSFPRDLSWY